MGRESCYPLNHDDELFVVDVIEAVDRLVDFPKSGRIVPELSNSAVREVILGNYRIVYRLAGQSVHVLTIFHGARLLNPRKLKHP